MATSGTTSFQMSRDDVITSALLITGAYSQGDDIPAPVMNTCASALNILTKALALEGLPLWSVQDIAVPLVAGQATYNISTITNSTLPIRVLDAYLRNNATSQDVSLLIISRYDYDLQGSKFSPGVPNQLFYDPQINNGSVTLYNVPADSLRTLHLVIQRQLQDYNLATDNPDLPQEAYQMLRWALADEISLEMGCPTDQQDRIAARAAKLRAQFFDAIQEQAPISFHPIYRTSR